LANLAKRAIEKENLGKDEITDFLAVSFLQPIILDTHLVRVPLKFRILICVWI